MDIKNFNQNINGTVNGNVNMAGRDINIGTENTDKIYGLLAEIKSCIEDMNKVQEIQSEDRENVMDDIAVLEEQCKNKNASIVKIRKAIGGIVAFVKSIPDKVAGATLLVTKVTELQEVLQKLVENISK